MGFAFAYELPSTQSKKENKLTAVALFARGSGCCPSSAPRVFSCSSSDNSALFPLGAILLGLSVSMPLHLPFCTIPCILDADYPEVGICPSRVSISENPPRGWYTDFRGVYFLLKVLSWKNINQEQLLAILPALRNRLVSREMKEN